MVLASRSRRRLISLAALAVLLLASGLLSAQEAPLWKPLGPWGGTITGLAIHPTQPGTLYAAGSSLAGVVRSTDGGASWKLLPGSPLAPVFVTLDPAKPSTVYAAERYASRVFRSNNGGASWQLIRNGLPADLEVSSLAVDPSKPSRLYLGSTKGLWKSENGGASWQRANRGLPAGGNVAAGVFPILRQPAVTAYVNAYPYGLFRTSNGGALWKPVPLPDGGAGLVTLAQAPSDPRTLYASFSDRIYRSVNGGESWVRLDSPGRLTLVALAVHPRAPRTVYGGTAGSGLFKSTDGGQTWALVGPSTNYALALAVDSSPQAVVYAGLVYGAFDPGGVLRSTDGGATWERRNLGLPGLSAYAIAVDPAASDVLSAAAVQGLFRSANGGRFVRTDAGYPPRPGEAVILEQVVASGPGTFHALEVRRSLLWTSTDEGFTWSSLPIPDRTVFLRADPTDEDILYVMTEADYPNRRIHRSLDGGLSWAPLALSPPFCGVADFSVSRPSASSPALFHLAGTRTPIENCEFYRVAAISRSADGGGTWTDVSAGLPRGDTMVVSSVAGDPHDGRLIYAGLSSTRLNAPRGVWKSTDAGATWQRTPLAGGNPSALTTSPTGVVWAATTEGRVYRSGDTGSTWENRSGSQTMLTFGDFAFDPVDAERAYLAGFGGVWVTADP